ncbi:MAG: beta galactosidase jelly roll domain-containing protein [Melioribacteraceae bacterium]|nr:MAG: beta galactosidase jelly roll domain-containing protein [Melioribacteraceae bacterium]
MKTSIQKILVLVLLILIPSAIKADEWERVVNLRGYWKFTIGDDLKWSSPNHNDNSWEDIRVPSSWESQGFHGYNGYAWYRTTFELPRDAEGYSIKIQLGYIDDVDEVYLNGNLIGKSGSFPPNYYTAYNVNRSYPIPDKYLNKHGINTIAVRVFDSQLDGGITGGDIGVFAYTGGMKLDLNLEGEWKISAGDNFEWKDANFNDRDWESIFVPGYWEPQGWTDYDGFAWYRLEFTVPEKLKGKKLVMVLGKIDDLDEAYINGKKVGSTGVIDSKWESNFSNEYAEFRGYFLADDVIKFGEKNILAVRVYDGYLDGGIYEGPIGLITQDKYRTYWKEKKRKKNIWDIIFGN